MDTSKNEEKQAVKLIDKHKSSRHDISISQICWDQGISASSCKSKYNVPYNKIIGVPVDKDGQELHSKDGETAGYKLKYYTDAVWEDGIGKYRTCAEIENNGKPIVLSVDEFEGLVKEAAQNKLEICFNRVYDKLKRNAPKATTKFLTGKGPVIDCKNYINNGKNPQR